MDINTTKVKKYVGSCCGNSFVIVDCREFKLNKKTKVDLSSKEISKYKVDSALFINSSKNFNINVEIFEKDGSESDSCGNGMLLISNFLKMKEGTIKMKRSAVTIEGTKQKQAFLINLKFSKIKKLKEKNSILVKIGEPHIVFLTNNLNKFDLTRVGEKLQTKYPKGVNVDAIQKVNEYNYLIKTYERGVFAITKSCGTGALSSFIAISYFNKKTYNNPVSFKSSGGQLIVSNIKDNLRLETFKKNCKIKKIIN